MFTLSASGRVGSVCGLRYEALFLSTSAYFMLNSRKHKTKTVRLGIYMFMFVQNVSTHMDIYIGSPRCRYSFCPEHIFNFAQLNGEITPVPRSWHRTLMFRLKTLYRNHARLQTSLFEHVI